MAGWFGLTSKNLLGSYDRTEVHPESLFHVPNDWKKETLFCQPQGRGGQQSDKEKREDKLLEDVTKSRTWPSHNHQTEQEVLSDFSLVSRVVSHKWDWGRLETGWHAALLPEGHAVLLHGQPVLVIKSYRRGALCWPGHFCLQSRSAGHSGVGPGILLVLGAHLQRRSHNSGVECCLSSTFLGL